MQRSSFIPNRTWLNKLSRAPAYTSHLVDGHRACRVQLTIVCFKKIYNQVWVLKSMKIREIWTTKYIEWLARTRQIVL